MALMPMNLRLEANNGSGGREYRIREGEIEFRPVNPSTYDDNWHPLSPDELSDHVQHNTIVAQWLKHRIGWRRLLLKCADQDTLEMYRVPENAVDRFAA